MPPFIQISPVMGMPSLFTTALSGLGQAALQTSMAGSSVVRAAAASLPLATPRTTQLQSPVASRVGSIQRPSQTHPTQFFAPVSTRLSFGYLGGTRGLHNIFFASQSILAALTSGRVAPPVAARTELAKPVRPPEQIKQRADFKADFKPVSKPDARTDPKTNPKELATATQTRSSQAETRSEPAATSTPQANPKATQRLTTKEAPAASQLQTNPLWNHILTVSLQTFRTKLFFKENLSPDTIEVPRSKKADSDVIAPVYAAVPFVPELPLHVTGNAVSLGAQTLSKAEQSPHWSVPMRPSSPDAQIIPFAHRTAATSPHQQATIGKAQSRDAKRTVSMDSDSRQDVSRLPQRPNTSEALIAMQEFTPLWTKYTQTPPTQAVEHAQTFKEWRALYRSEVPDGRNVPILPTQERLAANGGAYGANAQAAQQFGSNNASQEEELKELILSELQKAGYLDAARSEIRNLENVTDAIHFINIISRLITPGYDLFDILSRFRTAAELNEDEQSALERGELVLWNVSFGAQREIKDLNATLRTFGQWESREGSKAQSLGHGFGNRLNALIQINELFDDMPLDEALSFLRIPANFPSEINGTMTDEAILAKLPATSIVARLLVEARVADLHLTERADWSERLFAHLGTERMEKNRELLLRFRGMLDASLAELLQRLKQATHSAKDLRQHSA